MNLERATDPSRLYSATGPDVNPHRPLFTGDVFSCVEIPGVGKSAAIVIGHPCSFRGRNGRLAERTPVASVGPHERIRPERWSTGYYNRMPLPGLPLDGEFHAAWMDRFGLTLTRDLTSATRVACLSHTGINQLQQRLVFHQTRLNIPTGRFHEAFAHTYEEADLLEEWNSDLEGAVEDTTSSFESWIQQGSPNRQSLLRKPEERAHVRREMRKAITQMKAGLAP